MTWPTSITILAILLFAAAWVIADAMKKAQVEPEKEKPLAGLTILPMWSLEEAMMFRKFMDSELGKSFLARARAVERNTALRGCEESYNIAHGAGRAKGFSEFITWMESLYSDATINSLSGASAVQDANYPATDQQNEGQPVELRRSF